MITKFGIWEIHENGINGKVNSGYDYFIHSQRLWEAMDYEGHLVWDWLIHLTEKSWINKDNINDFNTAFMFGQDYFKALKPKEAIAVSTAQSLFIQKQILDNDEIAANIKSSDDEVVFSQNEMVEKLIKRLESEKQIKFLEL